MHGRDGSLPMALRLRGWPCLADEVRGLASSRVDAALAALQHTDDLHQAIHRARKRFKEQRAVLRLFEALIGMPTVREENGWYRDWGRRLSAYRDAQALVEAVGRLEAWSREPAQTEAVQACRQALAQRRDRLTTGSDALAEQCRELIQGLETARRRIVEWPIDRGGGGADVAAGFRRWYRRGRRALVRCRSSTEPAHWHAWRKRVKDHWYHLRILRPLWPPVLDALQGQAKRLSDLLGDAHDLDVLEAVLRTTTLPLPEPQRREVLQVLTRRRLELRREARSLGERVYAERSKAYAQRLLIYWRLWQASLGHGAEPGCRARGGC